MSTSGVDDENCDGRVIVDGVEVVMRIVMDDLCR